VTSKTTTLSAFQNETANQFEQYDSDRITITNADVESLYSDWETPTAIISDGAYGTGLFPGEPNSTDDLTEWYEPHVKAWSKHASPQTTLWVWNTELGWAEIHPLLQEHGWEYRGANIWDKGLGHIAGNSNTQKLRKFPQVSEMCVQYVKQPEFESPVHDSPVGLQEWVISEWNRTGLTLQHANEACGVADAASRKYLTKGEEWYYPPPEKMEKLVAYANTHGESHGKPYFAPDGDTPITGEEWEAYRAKFNCPMGTTNVWSYPQVAGDERLSDEDGAVHSNQKPLELMRRIIEASTEQGDVVWEPFGGLCTGAVAGKQLKREVYAAEIVDEFYEASVERVKSLRESVNDIEQRGIREWC